MTDNDRPLKRARLSSTEPHSSPPQPPTSHFKCQHSEFWLPDGNIILVANNAVAFRVYRGLLAAQSTVFEDMFVSSTSSADELFDGCPVVQLTDSSEDLTHLLRVLLPKSERRYHHTERRTFDELSAVIRLAHKYHIQDVQDQALDVLRETVISSRFVCCDDLSTVTHSLLPCAFYICAYLGGQLMDGWEREDGTVEHLSTADLRRCLDGQRTLAVDTVLLPGRILVSTLIAGCNSSMRCRAAFQRTLVDIVTNQRHVEKMRALDFWDAMVTSMGSEDEAGVTKICNVCQKELMRKARREMRLIWKKLPEIFGVQVEGWGAGEG
ncbi:hypothetical protein V8D89_006729 [Ganoderma adspersum]